MQQVGKMMVGEVAKRGEAPLLLGSGPSAFAHHSLLTELRAVILCVYVKKLVLRKTRKMIKALKVVSRRAKI